MKKFKVSDRARERFAHFYQCQDTLRLNPPDWAADGHTALEAFHALESWGEKLPTCEPEALSRALNGKAQHGMTVRMMAESYVERTLFGEELDALPGWVRSDVLNTAAKVAQEKLGHVPTFVRTGKDFSNLPLPA